MNEDRKRPVDLGFLHQLPRQREFLSLLLPHLQDAPFVLAVWLSGSLAREDADRWSRVNLHLLLKDEGVPEAGGMLRDLLTAHLPRGWHLFLESMGALSGLTGIPQRADARCGGVQFALHWIVTARLQVHLSWYRPVRILFTRQTLSRQVRDTLTAPWPALVEPNPRAVESNLSYFWAPLSRLAGSLNRNENLAASHLLDEARQTLVSLVVALNGAQSPPDSDRTNLLLGETQQSAFEKTLMVKRADPLDWIGQAVALIVLYQWYAPQLVEMYGIAYPQEMERTVLSLLSAEVAGWPATIRTG